MAKVSKRQAAYMRVKRENTLLKRQVGQLQQERVNTTTMVLLLLGQQGGDVTLDPAYLKSVQAQIPFMGFQVQVVENGDMQVKVVIDEEALAEAMATVDAAKAAVVDVPVPESAIILTDGV